ncbi:MAG: hypothetical protein CL508_01555 [Actinobacteria bacterium]|nr:hypothetical protein [Actinomycetota bacterium]|tara:strand:- start:185 stop:394 length:210 start_codon:yes stop_codon:yes gene_type:complete
MVNFANSILGGWGDAMNEAMRPEEGAIRVMQETKTVKVKCVYPEPDDGVSYSWIKVEEPKETESYGGSK